MMSYAEMLKIEAEYLKATEPKKVRKQRGATKATLAYRGKMLGACPDCALPKRICREVGGCQP